MRRNLTDGLAVLVCSCGLFAAVEIPPARNRLDARLGTRQGHLTPVVVSVSDEPCDKRLFFFILNSVPFSPRFQVLAYVAISDMHFFALLLSRM